jgi:ankyrin repeat protein
MLIRIVDKRGSTALIIATVNGCVENVQLLLQKCADPNIISEDGCALYFGAGIGHEKIVTLLLDYRANVDAVDK